MSDKAISDGELDLRVRERNLRKGLISEKDVEKHIAELRDLEEEAVPFGLPQPALGGREG